MTGMAFHVPEAGRVPEVGTVVPLRLMVRSATAFSGCGEVVRTEQESRRTKVSVRLVDALLEPTRLRELHDRLLLEDAICRGTTEFDPVPIAYRQLCGDAALFLNYWRTTLDQWEGQMGEPRGADNGAAEVELRAETRMREEWARIRERGNETTAELELGDPAYGAAKRFTEVQLTPLILSGALLDRAYRKPRGYPGDYLLMNYMYNAERVGRTAFGRILHQIVGREERLAATVPSRRDFLVHQIRAAVSAHGSRTEAPARIMSLGAGPAREVEDYLKSGRPVGRLSISLIDQDEDAIAFSCERARRAAVSYGDLVEVKGRFISFRQLMMRSDVLTELHRQHLIYSAGLVDYLSDSVARKLIAQCFELLAPNGSLLLGNAGRAHDVRWVPEFLLDWRMIYRSEVELRELAKDVADVADVSIVRDSSKAWYFLVVRKRASGRRLDAG